MRKILGVFLLVILRKELS